MRYGMLGLYSAVMQALGIAVAILSILAAVLVIGGGMMSSPVIAPMTVLIACIGGVAGAFVGLAYAALGQLMGLAIDVEHNTRMAIPRRPWED